MLACRQQRNFKFAVKRLFNVVENANKFPHAVILLKVPNAQSLEIHNLLQLKRVVILKLDELLKQKLIPLIIDALVYCKKGPYATCSIFEDMIPKFRDLRSLGRDYILGEYDRENLGDNSLNRCTPSANAIEPESFKIGKTTPGKENDCAGPHFIISHTISGYIVRRYRRSNNRQRFISRNSRKHFVDAHVTRLRLPPNEGNACSASSFSGAVLQNQATESQVMEAEESAFNTSMTTDVSNEEIETELSNCVAKGKKRRLQEAETDVEQCSRGCPKPRLGYRQIF